MVNKDSEQNMLKNNGFQSWRSTTPRSMDNIFKKTCLEVLDQVVNKHLDVHKLGGRTYDLGEVGK